MPINFVRTPSKNYMLVQDQILGLIKQHIPPDRCAETMGEKKPGHLNFSLFIHQPADIVMSHGVADKNYFFRKDEAGDRIANRLSHVFVPGPWLKRRLVANNKLSLSEHQVHVVGWPRLDALVEQQASLPTAPIENRRKRILWAPTHDFARRGDEQVSLSSYPDFADSISLLEQNFDVMVSLHPRNRRDKIPTTDKMLWADYVVSDFGTMVYEAWSLGKPVIFPDWIIKDRILNFLPAGSAEYLIFKEGIGLHPKSLGELIEMLGDAPSVDFHAQNFLDDYLSPEYKGESARRIAALLLELSGGRFGM
jgi:hypothetical protein